ncbi:RagB/SusD family nutrient uptake outer membrane protein [Cesiribacter andamanensis]|uniref:SusD family protein n=1 Tax=Cesiribacter andamanensis AMV16 TaxID=1279009 RepID=M7NB60_9BACT|nr:RagB/SusD family nutrient uptake outer membrane protein [Cesiribacter andamanensis]EMR04436.1 SusD family protein [Cesiribacter andamanensis AMV16]
MKKIILSAAVLGTVFLAGCTDKLELEPEQSLSNEQALNSFAKAQTAIYGSYDGFQALAYYGRDFPVMADANSDDIVIGQNSGRFLRDNDFQYSAEYATSTGFWNAAYAVIGRANNVINAMPNITDGSEEQRNQVLGEALFIRALAHFDLVRRFAQPYSLDNGAGLGVPYITVTEIGEPSRNTVAEVYNLVIADLERAETLMTQDVGKFRANKKAAQALLSRVHLYRGTAADNQKVVDWANAAETGMSLVSNADYLADWFSDGSAESFFELKFVADENRGADNYGYIYLPTVTTDVFAANIDLPTTMVNSNGYGDLRPSNELIGLLDENDIRRNFIQFVPGWDDDFQFKFLNQVADIAGLISPRILRLSEVVLNRAEANAKLGNFIQARADLNRIRTRAGLPELTLELVGNDNLLMEILEERRRELMFEGHRFYDLMRNGMDLIREDCGAIATSGGACRINSGDTRVAYPIPQREIDANPGMAGQQNPGYGG